MEEQSIITAQEQKNIESLEAGLAAADRYITRSYLIDLSGRKVVRPEATRCQDVFLRIYQVSRFVYDKKENVNDKLISVYSSLHELDGTAILIIRGNPQGIDFYLGARSERKAALCGQVLEKSLIGNFPGSATRLLKTKENTVLLGTVFQTNGELPQNVSTVSVIPSSRDEDKDKFVQGIEKFIDTMQGENYTAIFIAEPISKTGLEYRKRGLEELSTALSPFSKTTLAYGENYSKAVATGMTKNFSKSVNRSIANTTGYNQGTNTSVTSGANTGLGAGGINSGGSRSRTAGYSSGASWSKSVTEGSSDTYGVSTNTSDTETTGDSRTLTVEHLNKSVSNLMEVIDEQLKRIKDCESFGLWDCSAYFISPEIQISVMAANAYKALVSGDKSNVENAFLNVWDARNEFTPAILESLRYGLHPQFLIPENTNSGIDSQIVSPGSFISGKELPLFMGAPQKSVSGLTVNSIAEFSRSVFTLDNSRARGDLHLGHIFHMGRTEKAEVSLDTNSFTSHCFVSGSTGAGKSNTTYVLLGALAQKNIPFLVIEPAKGEYKHEFSSLPGIHIFSTNPRYGQMLRLNPFWFDTKHIHVLEHLDRLIEIFNACWEMYAAMPAILKSAAEQIYIRKGWDILNSSYIGEGTPQFPTFSDLLNVLPEIIKTSGYSSDTQGDYTGALVTRVASLANGISGQIFCSGSAVADSVLFDENTIVDLSRVGSSETKSLIMGLLVMKLTEYRTAQATGSNRELRHITVIEEAHNLLKRTSTDQGQESANLIGKSVEMISNSIAEMRTYGEGFIIVDQSPTAVDISAIKNTNTKIIMRLPEKSDCEAVGNAMALNEDQVKELAKLPTGVAAVIQNNWLEAALVKVDRAPGSYQGRIETVDASVLRELRGVIATQVVRQYYDDRQLDIAALEEAVSEINTPEHKKQELFDSVRGLITALDDQRDTILFTQWLLSFSCCQSAFDMHEQDMLFVDLKKRTAEDYKCLQDWRNQLEASVLKSIAIDPNISQFFVRNLIFAQRFGSGKTDYRVVYDMLYEEPRPDEPEAEENHISAIEDTKQKVL